MSSHTTMTTTEGQRPETGLRLPSLAVTGAEGDVPTRVEAVRTNGSQNGSKPVTAHELHNVISVIIAEAQLLQLHHPANGPNYHSAVAIERAGRRLEALIDRLPALRDTTALPNRQRRDDTVQQDPDSRLPRVVEQVTESEEA